MPELEFLSATEQARLVRRREVSPVELVSTYLERIEKFDSTLNSFVTVTADLALEEARRAEAAVGKDNLPPMHGVPVAIKDLTETAGIRTTFSSKAYADYVPEVDAASVRRLKDAGFIVLGKTNASEFGTFPQTESELNGICRNPWNPEHTPGGSSGGAAAAVAAGLSPVAHGSDGGGSIRIPSSFCGVFGIKPTRGRVSYGPRFGESWNGMGVQGPVARSVADAAATLDAMSGYEPGDPYWAPPPERSFAAEAGRDAGVLRVAFTGATPTGVPTDPDVSDAAADAAGLVESLGHVVEDATPEWTDPTIAGPFVQVIQAAFAHHDREHALFEPVNRMAAEQSRSVTSYDYIKGIDALHAYARRVVPFWDRYDVLLTPVSPLLPPPVGWIHEEQDPWGQLGRAAQVVAFTSVANITGQPAVSIPLAWNEAQLPIGIQLIGRPADDATLIRLSAQLEAARPWVDRRPPIS